MDEVVTAGISPNSFAKRQKIIQERKGDLPSQSLYVNPDFIQPTTVKNERLFSKLCTIFTDERKRMSPRLLEAIMLLKENEEWWSIATVNEVVDRKGNDPGWETRIASDHEEEADDVQYN